MKVKINNIANIKNDLYSEILKVKVDSIICDTSKSKILVLKRIDNGSLPIFFPGQYINIFLEIAGISHLESFSLLSSSDDALNGEYRIAIKSNKKKIVSKYLYDNIKYQDELTISRPLIDSSFMFSPLREEKNIIAIGYDNDIVSYYSLANYLIKNNLDYKLNIIHLCSNENNIILKDKFHNLSTYNQNINYTYYIVKDDNMRDVKSIINKYITEFNSFFVAGNLEFYKNINEILCEYNLPKKCLRFKKFSQVLNRNFLKKYNLILKTIEQELTLECNSNESIFKSILKSEYGKKILINNELKDDIYGEVISGSVITVAKFNQEAHLNNKVINLNDSYPCEDLIIRIN